MREDSGLPGRTVSDVMIDADGNVWISFDWGGVSRFDGQTWTRLTSEDGLSSDRVTVIFQDRTGTMWFGTDGFGISRYDGGVWSHLTTENGLASNKVSSILQDRAGNYWIGTEGGGVSRFDGRTWTKYDRANGLTHDEIEDGIEDIDGNLWFATEGGGVSRFDGTDWTSFSREVGPGHEKVRSLFQDRDGNIWFGTDGTGVTRFDGDSWENFDVRDGLVQSDVEDIYQSRDGSLWFGTDGGVSRYDGRTWVSYTTRDGLAYNKVRSVVQDPSGEMWFGTEDGLSRFDPSGWTSFANTRFLGGQKVKAIFQDAEGNIWFGTDGRGVARYDGRNWVTFTREDGLSSNEIENILQDRDGNIWVGTEGGGISRFDGDTWTIYSKIDGLAHDEVEGICEGRDGDIWVATDGGGISRFDGLSWTTFDTDDGLAHNEVKDVIEDARGALWIATEEGLSRFDDGTWTRFGTEDGLGYHKLETVFLDSRQILWVGTDGGGISRYDGKTWQTFTTQDGLSSNVVLSITEDDRGHLWFGTEEGGVSKFDGKYWTSLTTASGLLHDVVRAVIQDRDGFLWFGTEGGVSRYLPPATSAPVVDVDAIVADRRHEGVDELSIPSSLGLVAFEFSAASASGETGPFLYEYRLNGFDNEWKSTRHHRVEYQNLARGDYRFEVRAIDRDLVYSDAAATATLRVHLPWIYLAIGGMLGLALLLIVVQTFRVFRRERSLARLNAELRRSHEELEHRVGERTADLQSAYEKLQLEVADRRRAEGALAASEERYRLLVELSPDIISIHRDDHIAFINEGGARLLGAESPDDIVGMNAWDLMHPDYVKPMRRYLRHLGMFSRPPVTELKLKKLDGHDLDVEIAAIPFAHGDVPAILVISRDITERKRADEAHEAVEQELETQRALSMNADRLRSLGEMAAGIAHELNQPLVGVRGLAEHTLIGLERGWDSSPATLRQRLSGIVEQADRMVHIIDHVRRFAREAGKPEVSIVYINDVVDSSLELLGAQFRSHGITLATDLDEDLPTVQANPFSLEEVLLNLLNNARDAVEQAGRRPENAAILISTQSNGDGVQVVVNDNGDGIPEEIVAKVFDPFFTTKDPDKGTGLGLSISRSIVEEFGGSMEIRSTPRQGTSVSFSIPAS